MCHNVAIKWPFPLAWVSLLLGLIFSLTNTNTFTHHHHPIATTTNATYTYIYHHHHHKSNSFHALPLYASSNDCCIVHSTSASADPELVGGSGSWSCMLLLHPTLTCADAGLVLCTLTFASCTCSDCHQQQLMVMVFLPQPLAQIPHLHTWWFYPLQVAPVVLSHLLLQHFAFHNFDHAGIQPKLVHDEWIVALKQEVYAFGLCLIIQNHHHSTSSACMAKSFYDRLVHEYVPFWYTIYAIDCMCKV